MVRITIKLFIIYLKYLIFGVNYNTPVYDLPDSLIHLEFGFKYNQYNGKWPRKLKVLKFGWEFNQPLFKLPMSLEYIKLGNDFDDILEEPHKNIIIKQFKAKSENYWLMKCK